MRMTPVVLMITAVAFSASAQFRPFQSKAAQQRAEQLRAAHKAANIAPGAPAEELNVSELLLKRKELTGQVVKLTFDRVIDLKQAGEGYTARVTYESPRAVEGFTLIVPAEGLEFFQPLSEHRGPDRETVYVQVLTFNEAKVLGTRYNKTKPEGERYSW